MLPSKENKLRENFTDSLRMFWAGRVDTVTFYDRDAETHDPTFAIAYHFSSIMAALGYPPDGSNEGLRETPIRVAEMFTELLTPNKDWTPTVFSSSTHDMVIVRRIPFASLCEHHFLPFHGLVTIGYIQKDVTVGLSKFGRAIQQCAASPQTQERFTAEVAGMIKEMARTEDVGVMVKASHMCMELRGPRITGAETITNSMSGSFLENMSTRAEFVNLANL